MARDGNWWSLDAGKINDLQQDAIAALVRRCKGAHFVDVHVRINGKWEVYQADWIKHLQPRPRPILGAWRHLLWTFKRLRWRIQDRRPRPSRSEGDSATNQKPDLPYPFGNTPPI